MMLLSLQLPIPLLVMAVQLVLLKRMLRDWLGQTLPLFFTPPSLLKVGNKTDMPMASIREWFPGLLFDLHLGQQLNSLLKTFKLLLLTSRGTFPRQLGSDPLSFL
ncbi:2-succinyl-5-enolpyruvyl-6-hydroxy-3-cyclohexene-1-carboxylate synthase [Striga asiatica]|uniref:2-succinyl-5-enolpyruvyl-6-hydroxy-3-cyclohexene-1-carboxylate synthase n=1 Tax=Striga asiatica TaxID=4170 RepID=A0A5A7QJU7_STRAF|nr:2-succinyl-5-enolpyruvyl-6-hydroxy-3-cyclohexene-1-carboxylate synthase [Striga asiatica]